MRIRSHPSLSIFLCLFIVLCGANAICGQDNKDQDNKEKAQEEAQKQRELQQKTLALLNDVANSAFSLEVPENRSYVLMNAAGLLWPRDDKRARNLFWDALNSLNLPKSGPVKDAPPQEIEKAEAPTDSAKKPATKAPTKEQLRALDRYYETYSKRSQFLRQVAARDPQLALEMLRATRQSPPPVIPGYTFIPTDADLEKEIAAASASYDPARALEIARQSLAKGLSFQLVNLLTELNQRDQNTATEFAAEIISKLNPDNVGKDMIAGLIATQLLIQSRVLKLPAGKEPPPNFTYKELKLSDEQKALLVNLITDAALGGPVSEGILSNLRHVMPEIEQYAPDRVGKLQAKLATWRKSLNKEQQEWNNLDALSETGTPEQMIKAADKMGSEQRDSAYRSAVIEATMRGRADALREYINTQVEDDSRKKNLLDLLDTEQIYAAVGRGNAAELKKLLPQIRLKEQQAMAMAELAILLEKQGAHDEAESLLDDARALVKVDLMSEKQSNALLAVMVALALVDPDKAFQMIEPIIDRVNRDLSRLLLLDKVAKTGMARNGEILMQQPNFSAEFAILKFSPGLLALARADFERTKSLTDRFDRNEMRVLARLMLTQALLRSDQQTAVK